MGPFIKVKIPTEFIGTQIRTTRELEACIAKEGIDITRPYTVFEMDTFTYFAQRVQVAKPKS